MLPDLESLRCFEAAGSRQSFREAAHAVGLSPAAFSERIRRLEEQLEIQLFERSTRRVYLTDAGKRLLTHVRVVLEQVGQCRGVAHDRRALAPHEITLGTRFELGMSWIVPALSQLRELRPERTLHLFFGDGPDLLRRVERGNIDCMVSSIRLTSAKLTYAPLHEEHYTFVASKRVAEASPISGPEHADQHRLLDLHGDLPLWRYFLDALPAGDPWRFDDTEYLGTIGAVRLRVLEHAGVAVLPRYFIESDLESGALVELLPDVEPRSDWFRLVWRADDARDASFHELADQLRERPLG